MCVRFGVMSYGLKLAQLHYYDSHVHAHSRSGSNHIECLHSSSNINRTIPLMLFCLLYGVCEQLHRVASATKAL